MSEQNQDFSIIDLEKRIIQLETTVSYQDDIAEDLKNTISEQEKVIYQLERKVSFLMNEIKNISSSIMKSSGEEAPPPHY